MIKGKWLKNVFSNIKHVHVSHYSALYSKCKVVKLVRLKLSFPWLDTLPKFRQIFIFFNLLPDCRIWSLASPLQFVTWIKVIVICSWKVSPCCMDWILKSPTTSAGVLSFKFSHEKLFFCRKNYIIPWKSHTEEVKWGLVGSAGIAWHCDFVYRAIVF